MLDVTAKPRMPRKVLAKAVQLGVHNDCVVGEASNACPQCAELVNLSFDFFYEDAPSLEALMDWIMTDLESDRAEDLS